MLVEIGLITAMIAAGKAADLYSTESAKQAVGSWIAQAPRFEWHKFVSQRSWFIYTKVFGTHSASVRFIITSVILYLIICLGSFVFLFFVFPATYESVVSAWTFGGASYKIWWSAAMAFGAALYVLANAQTLYFLEILKTAPNIFKFFLVAYADFLITASVSLFGVPILLTIYTFGVAQTDSAVIPLKLDFSALARPTVEQVLGRAESGALRSAEKTPHSYYTVRYSFADASIGITAQQADYEALREAIRGREARGTENPAAETIAIHDADGQVIGTQQYGKSYESESIISNWDKKISDEEFCRAFVTGAARGAGRMTRFALPATTARTVLVACRKGKVVSLMAPVHLRADNVKWGRVYNRYLLITLYEMTASITSGFNSYLALSPFAALTENYLYPMWNGKVETDTKSEAAGAFDKIIYDLYTYQSGSRNMVVHRGAPAGTVNVAIMSTALFNLLVMSIFFVVYPLMKIVAKYDTITKYVDLQKSPFTILTALIATWLAVLMFVWRLF